MENKSRITFVLLVLVGAAFYFKTYSSSSHSFSSTKSPISERRDEYPNYGYFDNDIFSSHLLYQPTKLFIIASHLSNEVNFDLMKITLESILIKYYSYQTLVYSPPPPSNSTSFNNHHKEEEGEDHDFEEMEDHDFTTGDEQVLIYIGDTTTDLNLVSKLHDLCEELTNNILMKEASNHREIIGLESGGSSQKNKNLILRPLIVLERMRLGGREMGVWRKANILLETFSSSQKIEEDKVNKKGIGEETLDYFDQEAKIDELRYYQPISYPKKYTPLIRYLRTKKGFKLNFKLDLTHVDQIVTLQHSTSLISPLPLPSPSQLTISQNYHETLKYETTKKEEEKKKTIIIQPPITSMVGNMRNCGIFPLAQSLIRGFGIDQKHSGMKWVSLLVADLFHKFFE